MWRWLFSLKETFQFTSYLATECGHKTKAAGTWRAFGEERLIGLPINDGTTEYCHDCIEKMTIQCAWCGKPIFISESVSLSHCNDPTWVQPEYAVEYTSNDVTSLVGCMRWECADSGLSYSGFWTTPGQVKRMPSPLELAMKAAASGRQEPVVFNDLSNPEQVLADARDNAQRIEKNS